jgi:hypothetical protein
MDGIEHQIKQMDRHPEDMYYNKERLHSSPPLFLFFFLL